MDIYSKKPGQDNGMGIDFLARQFENDPVLAFVCWCTEVPKRHFDNKHPLDLWVDLLRHCINVYADKNYKRLPKKPGWRGRALNGLLNRAQRLCKAFGDTEEHWETFLNGLIKESRRNLDCNPLTKKLFDPPKSEKERKNHFDQFLRLGQFLKASEAEASIWKSDQDFVLSLVREGARGNLYTERLRRLLNSAGIDQKIATAAIQNDLKAQHVEYMKQMDFETPARAALRRLVLDLGDPDLAVRVDREFGLLLATGQTFTSLIQDQQREYFRDKRRPNAKRRYHPRSNERH